jgi:hypothetical protein
MGEEVYGGLASESLSEDGLKKRETQLPMTTNDERVASFCEEDVSFLFPRT